MSAVLIIGYGNPLRHDDGLGWLAAQRLTGLCDGVDIIAMLQLTPELAEPIAKARCVIFVDASRTLTPGDVETDVLEAEEMEHAGLMTHHVSPGILLTMAHVLYGHCPMAYQFAMGGEHFELGDGFSPVVERAFPALVDRIWELAARVQEETVTTRPDCVRA